MTTDPETPLSGKVPVLRRLILAEIVLAFLTIPTALLEDQWLPFEVKAFLDSQSEAEMTTANWIFVFFAIPFLALVIASWVQLWRLKRRGRAMYTMVWLLTPVFYFLEPVQVSGPVTALLAEAAAVTAGVIFGVIYFSELRVHFDRVPN